jgi:DHA2 family multidrug resistance protein-like MFS transporter
MTTGAPPPRADWRVWTGLAVLALPTLLVSMDISILFLALPRLSESLGAGGIQQLWIMDIYGFVLSGFLITMGTLGDRIGSKRLLLMGGAAFGVLSAVAAFSSSPEMLITCRALLGVAGATLMPSGYALIRNMFLDDKQRSIGFAVFISCIMGGGTVGPVLGGILLGRFWWGSCFLIGVPVMLLLLVAGPLLLPENRNPHAGRLDLVSVALSLLAILPVVYGFKEISRNGLETTPVLAGLAGVVFAVLFVTRELRVPEPLLDIRLFANRTFASALVIMLLGSFLTAGMMLLFVQYLQLVKELTPLRAGVYMIPTGVATALGVMMAPLLAQRLRAAYVIAIGLCVAVVGLGILTQVGPGTSLVLSLGAVVITNMGVGPFVTLSTEVIQGAVPPQKAGSAGAVSQTSGEGGVALGLAVLGGIGVAVYGSKVAIPSGLPAGAKDATKESLAGATSAAARLPSAQAHELLTNAQHAFTSAMNVVAVIVASLAALLAVVAATTLRDAKRPGEGAPAEGAGDSARVAPVES